MNGNARLDGRERAMIDRCGPKTLRPQDCPERPTYYGVVRDGDDVVVIRCYRTPDLNAQEHAPYVPEDRRFPDDASAILAMRDMNDALLFGGTA